MISVIGDVMIDKYIYGTSYRQSPECSTAPVVVVTSKEEMIGGAGNTAINIYNLNAPVRLYCAVGYDGHVRNMLSGLSMRYTTSINRSVDIIKTRVYNNGNYIARLDAEKPVEHNEAKLVDNLFDDTPELIVISDYGKGTISNPKDIIERAKKLNIRVLVDTKSNLSDFKGAFLLKPNLKEFFEWTGIDMPEDTDTAINLLNYQLLKSAIEQLKVNNLIITCGDKGCIHVDDQGSKMYPALPIKAIDVTGAGDSFIAGMAVALYEGKGIKRSIEFANRVASISVTKKGTQHVARNEI
jgi:D-beta-D-heptose 7-phosphate kinase/D-beta-D-heptose 1-phosphate adenosyltransferase